MEVLFEVSLFTRHLSPLKHSVAYELVGNVEELTIHMAELRAHAMTIREVKLARVSPDEALKLCQGDVKSATRASQLGHSRTEQEQGVDRPLFETEERGTNGDFLWRNYSTLLTERRWLGRGANVVIDGYHVASM